MRSRIADAALAVLVVSLAARAATAGTNQWTVAGSGLGSAVNAVAAHPTRTGWLYAAAEQGLYVSLDGGRTWQARAGELSGRSVLSLAADPGRPDRLWAGVSDGLLHSEDAGVTWTRAQGLGAGVFAIAAGWNPDTHVYAGSFGRGVFVSADGGLTWQPGGTPLGGEIVFTLATSALEPGAVYAGTGTGLYVSSDAGRTWAPLGTPLQGQSVRSVHVSSRAEDAGHLVAGTFGGGVWQSTDQGRTWRQTNQGLGDLAVRHLAVDAELAQLAYAATSAGGFFRTTDGGTTWRAVNAGLPSLAARRVAILPERPRRILGAGTGVGVWEITFTPEPQLVMDRAPLRFPAVTVGQEWSLEVGVANAGEAALQLAAPRVEGSTAFRVAAAPANVAPGASGRMRVVFAPQARGEARAVLVVGSDDPDEPRAAIDLAGTGVQGEVAARPGRVLFGPVRVGAYRDTVVVLTNTGNAAVQVQSASCEPEAFRLLSFQPQALAPGQTLLLRLRFLPLVARDLSGRLLLTTQAAGQVEVPLAGVGTAPEISVASQVVDFGTVNVGVVATAAVEVHNSGNMDLTVASAGVVGEAFGVAATFPLTVAPGATRSVPVTFLPRVSGAASGSLRLESDALGRASVFTVRLEGIGGGLTLNPQPATVVGSGATDLLVADLDGDGVLDAAVADSSEGVVRVLRNDGTGAFPQAAAYPNLGSAYPRWDGPVALASGPVLSARPDLVVADPISRTLSILENDGQGHFGHRREDLFIGHRITDVIAADLDADGDVDLAATNGDAGSITLLYNNGLGSFGARVTRPVQAEPVALAAAHLDADGQLDLVVANRGAGSVSVLFSDRAGGYQRRQDFPVGLEPVDLALVDFDADGDNDVLVADRGSHDVAVLSAEPQSGGGTRYAVTGHVSLLLPVIDLAASDLTADIFCDLVAAGEGMARVAFLENEAGNGFTRRDTLAATEPALRTAIADLSGDGANDILVLGRTRLQLFVNQDARRLDPPRPPTRVTVSDVDRDLGRSLQVSWQAPELDEQIGRTTEYVVLRASRRQGPYAAIDTVGAGGRVFVDPAATPADTFFYYLLSGNAVAWSTPSDTAWGVSRPAPFFELQLVDEPRTSVGDTLRVRAFVTPAEHRLAGLSLYLSFIDSALTPLWADTANGSPRPFRLVSGLGGPTVLENRLHPGTTNRLDLSLAGVSLGPGVEPVELGEVWFLTQRDTVTYISIDDDARANRRSSVVEDSSGNWILPFIPAQPTRVSVHDYRVEGQVQLGGRRATDLAVP
ncbi:MAG: choice-of-anchor D domain-containing protein, partial [Candidatus Latescibacterota bacterium]